MDEHPIQGRVAVVILYPLHAMETGIRSRWMGQLAQVQTAFFTSLFPCHTPSLALFSCAELLNKGGKVSKETVVLCQCESIAGNLVLTTELKM